MIKVFTLNENKKIELTEKELKELLDTAYWEGRSDANKTYIYTTPYHNWWESPYYTTASTSSTGATTITLNGGMYNATENSI